MVVVPGPVRLILDAIRQLLDGWLDEPRRKQTEGRVAQTDRAFNADMTPLLAQGQSWNFDDALEVVWRELIAILPGDAWKGYPRETRRACFRLDNIAAPTRHSVIGLPAIDGDKAPCRRRYSNQGVFMSAPQMTASMRLRP